MKQLKEYKAPSIEAFNKMSRPRKRIVIAKDIIAAINTEKYIANSGAYILHNENESDDIQKTLPKMKECKVCAFGACVLSITKFKNKLKFWDIGGSVDDFSENTENIITSIFSPDQLAMIEIIFERNYDGITNYGKTIGAELDYEDVEKCIDFGDQYEDDTDRMIAIMTHIIDNKGEVVPDKM